MTKVDLIIKGNLLINSKLFRGGEISLICYADEENYEAEKTIQGDYILQGETGVIAATGDIAFIREGM